MLRKTMALCCALTLSFGLLAAAQSADELIAKNVQARGGMEKIKAVRSIKLTGKMSMGGGMEAPFTIQMKRPGLMRFEATIQGKTMVQGYDGETGWQIVPFMGSTDPEKMADEELTQLKEEADFDGPLVDYKDKGHTVELAGKEDMEGSQVYKLKVTLKNGNIKYFFIDPETYLILKESSKVKRQGADIEMDMIYSNYKSVEGLMVPFSMETRAKDQPAGATMVLDKMEIGVAMDNAIFKMPPKAPTPTPAAK